MNVAPEVALANIERGLADDPGSLALAHAVVANWNKLLESRDGESAADLASSLGLPEFLDVVDAERRVIERAAREDGLTHYERCMICAVEPALRPNDCPPWAIPD
jgi:predicted component of type VI protein secretion system